MSTHLNKFSDDFHKLKTTKSRKLETVTYDENNNPILNEEVVNALEKLTKENPGEIFLTPDMLLPTSIGTSKITIDVLNRCGFKDYIFLKEYGTSKLSKLIEYLLIPELTKGFGFLYLDEKHTLGISRLVNAIKSLSSVKYSRRLIVDELKYQLFNILKNNGEKSLEDDYANRHSRIYLSTVVDFLMSLNTVNVSNWFGDCKNLNWLVYCYALRDFMLETGDSEEIYKGNTMCFNTRRNLQHEFPLDR